MAKASKKSAQKPTKSQKKTHLAEQVLQNLSNQEQVKPKKRLRKHNKTIESSDEDFIPDSKNELDQNQSDISSEEQQFSRFKRQDDEDIRKQQEQKEAMKRKRKPKNNALIDKFIQNNPEKIPKQGKVKKESTVQLNLSDILKRQKQRKKEQKNLIAKSSSEGDESEEESQVVQFKKLSARENYYEKFQGNAQNMTEQQLIQKAMKMNLDQAQKQQAKHQKQTGQQVEREEGAKKLNKQDFVELDNFQFKCSVDERGKSAEKEERRDKGQNIKIQEGKGETRKQSLKSQSSQLQNIKSKKVIPIDKKKAKGSATKKEGPLSGEVIAFTGQFQPYSKDQLIELCQKLGAITPKTFSVKTTILFQGAFVVDTWKRRTKQDVKTTSKSVKAIEKGIEIVPNNQLDSFFIKSTGKSLDEHFRTDVTKLDSFVEKKEADNNNMPMDIQIDEKKFAEIKKDPVLAGKLWTDKYAPKSLEEVIGQHKQIRQLKEWLQDWEDVVLRGNKKDAVPNKGFLPSGTINSRAALLSGDPGLGKTTTARLLAKQLNYSVTEFNASDIRNKKGVQLLESHSYGLHESSSLVKNLIIMDEVDGMSKGDRGGITEIINMIKNTTVPIICICNDRQSEKIRALAGHCLDVKFYKPDRRLIIKRLQDIIHQEGGVATELVLSRIVQNFQNDMRQILTYLQLLFRTKTQNLHASDITGSMSFSKDSSVMLTHFDAARKLLNRSELNGMTMREKLECFFIDSDMVPLVMFQNYLSSIRKGKTTQEDFHKVVKATEGFILADQLNNCIRKEQDWSLMPSYGFMAAVYPSEMVAEGLGFTQFPGWLGKYSSQRKQKRLLKQLKHCIHGCSPATNKSIRYGQAAILYQEINRLLKQDLVEDALDLMEVYNLTPLLLNQNLLPLQFNPEKQVLLSNVSGATKAKLTRAFNKRHEEQKLRKKTKKAGVSGRPEHQKFNQILQEMQEDDDTEEDVLEENQSEEEEIKISKKSKKASTKRK